MVVSEQQTVRLDRWLWAARFYKTRAMATEAANGGKVQVNGVRAKPSKMIKPGYEIKVRKGAYEHTLIVQDLSNKRSSATIAQKLYQETDDSIQAREKTRIAIKSQPMFYDLKRPDKKQRRQVLKHKRGF